MNYINKLIKKIKLKECEYETVENMIKHYNNLVEQSINDIFIAEQLNKNDVYKQFTYTHTKIITMTPDYQTLLNTLYKNLSLKTHPDKTNGDDVDFKLIFQAYENKNILKMIEFANHYKLSCIEDIDINLLTLILEKEWLTIKNKVKNLKNSVPYQYLINGDGNIRMMIDLYKENQLYKQKNENLREEIKNYKKV